MRELELTPRDRVLVVAPHPDDEALGAGGLLARAARVGAVATVLFVTAGERSDWTQRLVEGRWRLGEVDRERWARRRRREAGAALRALGVPPDAAWHLGIGDRDVTRWLLQSPSAAVRAVAELVRMWRPTIVCAPSIRDVHADHGACAVLVALALRHSPAPPRVRLSYLVHRAARSAAAAEAYTLRLTPAEQRAKRQALLHHRSQLFRFRPHYLQFASAEEHYGVGGTAQAAGHPVRDARRAEGAIVFRLEGRLVDRHGGRLLALFQGGGTLHARTVELSPRSPAEPVARITVDLPPAALRELEGCFVKYDRGRGFWDEDGWRFVPGYDLSRSARALDSIARLAPAEIERFGDTGDAATSGLDGAAG